MTVEERLGKVEVAAAHIEGLMTGQVQIEARLDTLDNEVVALDRAQVAQMRALKKIEEARQDIWQDGYEDGIISAEHTFDRKAEGALSASEAWTLKDALPAVAEAWASIDGKLDEYHNRQGGHHEGYLADAQALVERLRKRGFDVKPPSAPRSSPSEDHLFGLLHGWFNGEEVCGYHSFKVRDLANFLWRRLQDNPKATAALGGEE